MSEKHANKTIVAILKGRFNAALFYWIAHEAEITEGSYHVLGLPLSVQWLCDVQNTRRSVHGEKTIRRLISSWTSDAVVDFLYLIFTWTDLKQNTPGLSYTTLIDYNISQIIFKNSKEVEHRSLTFAAFTFLRYRNRSRMFRLRLDHSCLTVLS